MLDLTHQCDLDPLPRWMERDVAHTSQPSSPKAGCRKYVTRKVVISLSLLAVAGIVAALVATLGFGPKGRRGREEDLSTLANTVSPDVGQGSIYDGYYSEQLNNAPIFTENLVKPGYASLKEQQANPETIINGNDSSPNAVNGKFGYPPPPTFLSAFDGSDVGRSNH